MSALISGAKPLKPEHRDGFLMMVAELLRACPDFGDGDVHRAVREAQKRFFDPPLLNTAGNGPRHRIE